MLLEGISLKKPIVWIAAILYLAIVFGIITLGLLISFALIALLR